jgi:hypothetical protein
MLQLTLSTPNVNEHEIWGERTFILVIHEEISWYMKKVGSELTAENTFCCEFSAVSQSARTVRRMQGEGP